MSSFRFLATFSRVGLVLTCLAISGCQSTNNDTNSQIRPEQAPVPIESIPPKSVKKVATPPARDNGSQDTASAPAETPQSEPAQPAPPPQPEPPMISNQQIDRYLAEGQVTYERAAKLRYREATRAGQVKTKADHTYWSTVIEIYRNWDNRYISWDEVQKRLSAAEAAHQGQ